MTAAETRTPRTAAGRDMLEWEDDPFFHEEARDRILAIEAEAAAQPQPSGALREALARLLAVADEMNDGITEHQWAINKARAALAAAPAEGLDVRSARFREAVIEVFEAPGDWGPAQSYYAGDIDHFIDMLAAHLAAPQPAEER